MILLYQISLSIVCGIVYGLIFYFGKMHLLVNGNALHDFLFNMMRFFLLLLFFYAIFAFVASNSILMALLFVSSYLSTVGIIAYKS